MHPTTKYAHDIVSKKIIACKWEILACQRHLDDLGRQGTKDFPYVFDETRADRIFDFFKKCRHVKSVLAGTPIYLDNWQKFDLGCAFGWVDISTGSRRFSTVYIRVARGNTKSTMMSGIANYGMTADIRYPPGRPELATYDQKPEVVCGAVDKDQADIVWGDAREMAENSPALSKRLEIKKLTVTHKKRGGALKKLSKDTKNKDGGSPTMIIIDEYHAHPTSLIKDVTSSGKGKRPQCLEFIITTAGEDAENNPCRIEDDIIKGILQKDFTEESYFGTIREIDKEDDVHDESKWIKANPILQVDNEYSQVLWAQIKREHDLAFGSNDHSKIRQWKIKRINIWQMESQAMYFAGHMDKWKSLGIPRPEFLKMIKGTKQVYVGVDLAKCIDLVGVGVVVLLPNDIFAVFGMGFIPEEAVTAHRSSDKVPYDAWIKEGWCRTIRGAVVDDRDIIDYITDDLKKDLNLGIQEICYDPCGARQLANVLTDKKFTCVEIRQGGTTLSEPTKKFREKAMKGEIIHDGSPLLTWCLSNAYEVEDVNENIRITKRTKNCTQRIDVAAAIMNAMTRAIVAPKVSKPKVIFC